MAPKQLTPAEIAAQLDAQAAATRDRLRTPDPAAAGNRDRLAPNRAPAGINGPLQRDSEQFSITKAFVNVIGNRNPEGSKNEAHVLSEFRKALIETHSIPTGGAEGAMWLPADLNHLPERVHQHKSMEYVKSVYAGSGMRSDPDELAWLIGRGVLLKTGQSAYTDTLGGALVAPPTMGPVIPFIRPQAALLAAGAQSFPLPPQGRHARPRIIAAPSVEAVAESQAAPESTLGTDQMELSAKKIAGLARVSQEATNYTSGTIDTYTKAELDRSLGLKMDAYGFYGPGGPSIPLGLARYTTGPIFVETAYPNARGLGANGNALLPEYGDYLPALIGENSFSMEATTGTWIMRPSGYAAALGVRADAVTPGDQSGPLVDILRRFAEGRPSEFRGRRVVQTTNLKNTLIKGSGTGLMDAFFGIWQHCIVATYGAVQFQQGHDGTSFVNGQYLVRGDMFGDIGFEYLACFLQYTNLLGVLGLL